jgi:hypothetical protein
MAVCRWCEQEMTTASSCTVGVFHIEGRPVQMIAFGSEPGPPTLCLRCGDCGVVRGGHHHLGCDVQRCPLCRGQMMTCGCRFDEDGRDEDDVGEPLFVDANGIPAERRWIDGNEVIVRYDDIPASDLTTVDGIPCTTALRTVIDLAPEMEPAEFEELVRDALGRRLFTLDEARRRIEQPDMATRLGAALLRRFLAGSN